MQIYIMTLTGTRCERIDLPSCVHIGPKKQDGTFKIEERDVLGKVLRVVENAATEANVVAAEKS